MTLKIKRIYRTETLDNLPVQLPLYLTDEFAVWHYAVLDTETVLVVSSNSCQVQTFDETFNSKYSVTFDELTVCTAADFDEAYAPIRENMTRADQMYHTHQKSNQLLFLPNTNDRITAQAS